MKEKIINHICFKLKEWYINSGGDWGNNDFINLKINKLIFFTIAISSNKDNQGLFEYFDKIIIAPYGHFIKGIEVFRKYEYVELDDCETKLIIDKAINELKNINPQLINLHAFDLVELNWKWHSWQTIYSLIKKNNRFSFEVDSSMIAQGVKFLK